MSGVSLLLLTLSAAAHVHWNLLAKRAGGDQRFFAKLQLLGAGLVLPFGLIGSLHRPPEAAALAMAAVSGICYWGYYTCLGRAYSSGALSVAYPISRGVAPSAAALAGTLVLGERLGALGWAGVVLVSCGIFLVGRADTAAGASRLDRRTVLWAVATGLFSAGYM
ncbi:MAG: EamA family transporter, partial [Fimbriimonadales bacterium]